MFIAIVTVKKIIKGELSLTNKFLRTYFPSYYQEEVRLVVVFKVYLIRYKKTRTTWLIFGWNQ